MRARPTRTPSTKISTPARWDSSNRHHPRTLRMKRALTSAYGPGDSRMPNTDGSRCTANVRRSATLERSMLARTVTWTAPLWQCPAVLRAPDRRSTAGAAARSPTARARPRRAGGERRASHQLHPDLNGIRLRHVVDRAREGAARFASQTSPGAWSRVTVTGVLPSAPDAAACGRRPERRHGCRRLVRRPHDPPSARPRLADPGPDRPGVVVDE